MISDQDLVHAVRQNEVEFVKNALSNGAQVNVTDTNKRSLLLVSAYNESLSMATLLVAHGADVNQQADNLYSPFLFAGASGQTEMLRLFLAHGARFDVFNRYHGTALIPACERGHVDAVRLLAFTKGFPLDHINNLGWTALLEAVVLGDGSQKYQDIVKILKDAGARLDISDVQGITALQHAKRRRFREIVTILQP